MLRSRTTELSGWANFPREESHLFRPERLSELHDLVASANGTSADGPAASLISRGLGRSYGDAAVNAGGGVVLHERLNRFLGFDPETGVVECEAGASIEDLLEVFLPLGYFPPVTPGTKYVTIGGAIAADVHGKNHHRDGSFSEFLLDLQLLTAAGDTLHCSREENADAFWATVGGMGLTGAILSARIQLRRVESAYLTVEYRKAANLDAAMELFAAADASTRYSVAWIDCLASGKSLGRSVLMRGDHTPAADLPPKLRGGGSGGADGPLRIKPKRKRSIPFNAPSFALGHASVKLFNAVFYARHGDAVRVTDYDSFFYPLDSVLHWNRMYGKRGFVQYQVVLPPEAGRRGMVQLLEKLSASGRGSFLAVFKSMGAAGPGLLSFPRAGHTLALDLPHTGSDLVRFIGELDRLALDHGGRVYLAKDACLSPEHFRAMYPNLDRFREVKARLDPAGRFSSSLARRVGIVEPTNSSTGRGSMVADP